MHSYYFHLLFYPKVREIKEMSWMFTEFVIVYAIVAKSTTVINILT